MLLHCQLLSAEPTGLSTQLSQLQSLDLCFHLFCCTLSGIVSLIFSPFLEGFAIMSFACIYTRVHICVFEPMSL